MPNTLAPIEEVFAAMNSHVNYTCDKEKKRRDPTQSYDKSP